MRRRGLCGRRHVDRPCQGWFCFDWSCGERRVPSVLLDFGRRRLRRCRWCDRSRRNGDHHRFLGVPDGCRAHDRPHDNPEPEDRADRNRRRARARQHEARCTRDLIGGGEVGCLNGGDDGDPCDKSVHRFRHRPTAGAALDAPALIVRERGITLAAIPRLMQAMSMRRRHEPEFARAAAHSCEDSEAPLRRDHRFFTTPGAGIRILIGAAWKRPDRCKSCPHSHLQPAWTGAQAVGRPWRPISGIASAVASVAQAVACATPCRARARWQRLLRRPGSALVHGHRTRASSPVSRHS